jgi:hypothetical protein
VCVNCGKSVSDIYNRIKCHPTKLTYQGRKRVPCPERDHESKPREKEYTAIDVDDIKHRHSSGLPVDRVDLGCLHEVRECEGDPHIDVIFCAQPGVKKLWTRLVKIRAVEVYRMNSRKTLVSLPRCYTVISIGDTLQTQYIILLSSMVISKGSPAILASPEIRVIPGLRMSFPRPSLVDMHNQAPEKLEQLETASYRSTESP